MSNINKPLDPQKALLLLAKAEMKPFTAQDWDAYGGCTSDHALIGQVEGYLVILDKKLLTCR